MRAVLLKHLIEPSDLQLTAVSDPEPSAHEARIQLKAAALNHRDLFICRGQYAGLRFPTILGADGAGYIDRRGAATSQAPSGLVLINPAMNWGGDQCVHGPEFRILGMPDNGTFAEYVVVPSSQIYPAPAYLTPHEAAALPLTGLTAFRALFSRGLLKAGERVLITGVGGGVASMALVMAVAAGARVAVTSSSEQKRAQARVLGAELAVDYHGNGWIVQVRQWADEHGPDLVIDGAGGSSLEAALEVVRPGGRITLYGATLGNVPNLTARRIFWKQLTLVGTTMGSPADFQAMLDFTTAHQIHPPIDSVFPLSDIGKAMRRLDQGGQFGKIVLEIS